MENQSCVTVHPDEFWYFGERWWIARLWLMTTRREMTVKKNLKLFWYPAKIEPGFWSSRQKRGSRGSGCCRNVSRESQPALFEFVDVVAEFQCRPQLQPQIFHHHLAFQQEQSISIDLLKGRKQQNTNLSHNHANNGTPKTSKQSTYIKLPLVSTF